MPQLNLNKHVSKCLAREHGNAQTDSCCCCGLVGLSVSHVEVLAIRLQCLPDNISVINKKPDALGEKASENNSMSLSSDCLSGWLQLHHHRYVLMCHWLYCMCRGWPFCTPFLHTSCTSWVILLTGLVAIWWIKKVIVEIENDPDFSDHSPIIKKTWAETGSGGETSRHISLSAHVIITMWDAENSKEARYSIVLHHQPVQVAVRCHYLLSAHSQSCKPYLTLQHVVDLWYDFSWGDVVSCLLFY